VLEVVDLFRVGQKAIFRCMGSILVQRFVQFFFLVVAPPVAPI
jgi:hypothetical protein